MTAIRRAIDPPVYVAIALALLLLPPRWVAAFLLAACCHEFAHLLAVGVFGGRVTEVRMTLTGTRIIATGMSVGGWLCAVLAGPAVSLLLSRLGSILPSVAACAYVQLLCNLLPIPPSDGALALRCICRMCFRAPIADRICTIAAAAALIWVSCALVRIDITPAGSAILLLTIMATKFGKMPCKRRRMGVQ